MRTSAIVSHAVAGAFAPRSDGTRYSESLTYDPAQVTFTGSDGRPVDLSKDPPVLVTASGEKVYPEGPADPYDFAPRDQRTIRIRPADPRYAFVPLSPMLETVRALAAIPWSGG